MVTFTPRTDSPDGYTPGPAAGPNDINRHNRRKRAIIIAILVLFAVFLLTVGGSLGNGGSRNAPSRVFQISVDKPEAGGKVSLPITIQGNAKEDWFNNGTIPIQVWDGRNNLLVTAVGIAETSPETGRHAPFKAVIESFDVRPETRIGRIVIHKQSIRQNPANEEFFSQSIEFTSGYGSGARSGAVTTGTATGGAASASGSGITLFEPSGPGTCADGYDNDKDARRDAADPDCHSDKDPNNYRSFAGSRDEDPETTKKGGTKIIEKTNSSTTPTNTSTGTTATNNTTSTNNTGATGIGGFGSSNQPGTCGPDGTNCWGLPQN